MVINWGYSGVPRFADYLKPEQYINRPLPVKLASNKLSTFQVLSNHKDINIPDWTTKRDVVAQWQVEQDQPIVVMARTVLNGHSGAGINICEGLLGLIDAPLYVKYIKKAAEYRVHVAFGKVIDTQQKKKRRDYDGEVNARIRNHANGWVYCREDIDAPADLHDQAIKAVGALGLDFGAVDIIYNRHQNKCFTLEVNTAPGIEGSTVEAYANAFIERLNG